MTVMKKSAPPVNLQLHKEDDERKFALYSSLLYPLADS